MGGYPKGLREHLISSPGNSIMATTGRSAKLIESGNKFPRLHDVTMTWENMHGVNDGIFTFRNDHPIRRVNRHSMLWALIFVLKHTVASSWVTHVWMLFIRAFVMKFVIWLDLKDLIKSLEIKLYKVKHPELQIWKIHKMYFFTKYIILKIQPGIFLVAFFVFTP